MESLTLSQLLSFGWEIQSQVESGEINNSNSQEFKVKVEEGIQYLKEAKRRIDGLGLYSRNEELEEIATPDLKYMLIPVLLGDLLFQIMDSDRLEILHQAKDYFSSYLQRCYDYALTSERPPNIEEVSVEGFGGQRKTMEQLSAERQAKVTRFKAQREMENKVAHLKALIDSATTDTTNTTQKQPIDDEVLREHIISNLKLWIYKSSDYVTSILQEIQLLKSRTGFSQAPPPPVAPPQGATPFKPVVITKDMLKNKVFGAGYPSLPTMTVEEFYEKTYGQQNKKPSLPATKKGEEEDEETKSDDDDDDEEKLKKAREFDEYKDDHRRGWGNKKNMG